MYQDINLMELTELAWTVIADGGMQEGHRVWLCRCTCGMERVIHGATLRHGDTTMCADCAISRNVKMIKGIGSYLREYRHGAVKRGLSFELTPEAFCKLATSKCFYCGALPQKVRHGQFNGIDRVNNTIGYTESNCVPCCYNCNIAKGTRNSEEFKAWVRRVAAKWSIDVGVKTS